MLAVPRCQQGQCFIFRMTNEDSRCPPVRLDWHKYNPISQYPTNITAIRKGLKCHIYDTRVFMRCDSRYPSPCQGILTLSPEACVAFITETKFASHFPIVSYRDTIYGAWHLEADPTWRHHQSLTEIHHSWTSTERLVHSWNMTDIQAFAHCASTAYICISSYAVQPTSLSTGYLLPTRQLSYSPIYRWHRLQTGHI